MTNMQPNPQHLLDLSCYTTKQLHHLFLQAHTFASRLNKNEKIQPLLANKIIVSLFFEPSTRTQYSFEIAAKQLGACVITPNINNLSLLKGESLNDTLCTFEALGADLFILRHPDNFISELKIATPIINAGNGSRFHPTQTLTDLYTINQIHQDLSAPRYAIIGDIAHSRVANSLIQGLQLFGAMDIRLIAPKTLLPAQLPKHTIAFDSLPEGLKNVDVIICLRIQKERLSKNEQINAEQFFKDYAITKETIKYAKPNAIVLHPGPINYGIEIDSVIPKSSHSLINNQVQNSIPVKMALLDAMIGS